MAFDFSQTSTEDLLQGYREVSSTLMRRGRSALGRQFGPRRLLKTRDAFRTELVQNRGVREGDLDLRRPSPISAPPRGAMGMGLAGPGPVPPPAILQRVAERGGPPQVMPAGVPQLAPMGPAPGPSAGMMGMPGGGGYNRPPVPQTSTPVNQTPWFERLFPNSPLIQRALPGQAPALAPGPARRGPRPPMQVSPGPAAAAPPMPPQLAPASMQVPPGPAAPRPMAQAPQLPMLGGPVAAPKGSPADNLMEMGLRLMASSQPNGAQSAPSLMGAVGRAGLGTMQSSRARAASAASATAKRQAHVETINTERAKANAAAIRNQTDAETKQLMIRAGQKDKEIDRQLKRLQLSLDNQARVVQVRLDYAKLINDVSMSPDFESEEERRAEIRRLNTEKNAIIRNIIGVGGTAVPSAPTVAPNDPLGIRGALR